MTDVLPKKTAQMFSYDLQPQKQNQKTLQNDNKSISETKNSVVHLGLAPSAAAQWKAVWPACEGYSYDMLWPVNICWNIITIGKTNIALEKPWF